ncbi:PH domain-containing protein [Sporosarcina sp. CAU 1771]
MVTIFFASKRDSFYFIAVWGTILILLISILLTFSFTFFNLLWGLLSLLAIGFLIWIWFGTGYQIENETIQIKNGSFKWIVKIHDINRISKRRSLLATPSLSMDRLVVHYGTYGEMLLSPKDEAEFIDLLLTKNPQIELNE